MLQWIKDFLKNRTQEVVLNGKKSNSKFPIQLQVESHGINVGSHLIYIFVNDLPSIVSNPLYMFTGDTKIFHVIRTSEDYSALYNMIWTYFVIGQFVGP